MPLTWRPARPSGRIRSRGMPPTTCPCGLPRRRPTPTACCSSRSRAATAGAGAASAPSTHGAAPRCGASTPFPDRTTSDSRRGRTTRCGGPAAAPSGARPPSIPSWAWSISARATRTAIRWGCRDSIPRGIRGRTPRTRATCAPAISSSQPRWWPSTSRRATTAGTSSSRGTTSGTWTCPRPWCCTTRRWTDGPARALRSCAPTGTSSCWTASTDRRCCRSRSARSRRIPFR